MTDDALHTLLFESPAEYLKQKSETLLYCQLEIRKVGDAYTQLYPATNQEKNRHTAYPRQNV